MVVISDGIVSFASNMVTTMWGVCGVGSSMDEESSVGEMVVGTCAGGCTVVNLPALVRCVVISTSAGYSVKKGAAVVGTSVQRWCVGAVVSTTSSGGSVANVGLGTGTTRRVVVSGGGVGVA